MGSGDEDIGLAGFFIIEIGRDGRALVGAGPLGPGRLRARSRKRTKADPVGDEACPLGVDGSDESYD